MTKLTSRIDLVKIYSAGATITRIADLPLTGEELPEQVEISGLPLAMDDSSVKVRIAGDRTRTVIAKDIRIGLAVESHSEIPTPPLHEAVRIARVEEQQLEDKIALIENEIQVLYQLQIPDRPLSDLELAPLLTNTRLSLASFSHKQIRDRIQDWRETIANIRNAKKHLYNLLKQQELASDIKKTRLRKTVVVSLYYQGIPAIEPIPTLVIEYFVPGVRWTPTYVCSLNSAESRVNIAIRASICQQTGEDWSGVRLELSTAKPLAWCELPELPSLRLGDEQPITRKTGWRKAPTIAQTLFEDFDRSQQVLIKSVGQENPLANTTSPQVPPLPSLVSTGLEKASVDDDFSDLEKILDELEGRGVDNSQFASKGSRSIEDITATTTPTEFNFLAYGIIRMKVADSLTKLGKLSVEQQREVYLELLKRQEVNVNFDVMQVVQEAVKKARSCLERQLPPGGINVRSVAGSFDYAYSADGRVVVPSDGVFHSVPLTSSSTEVDLRYIVVPREDTNVLQFAELRNPMHVPLLSGPANIYVDGNYILSTNIATVPSQEQMELGLGVEQAIKVVRNTFYEKVSSGNSMVEFNQLRHKIVIDIINHLPREARIEVRERLPMPQKGAKVDVQIDRVTPAWEEYDQKEEGASIEGGYRWQVQVPARERTTLSVDYTIKTFVDSDVIGGNRRE